MKKKIETLNKLIHTIQNNKLNSGSYVYNEFDAPHTCRHCVIGHMLLNGGLPKEKLESLDSLDTNPYGVYFIDGIMQKSEKVENDFVGGILESLGFDVDDETEQRKLRHMQFLNDESNHSDESIGHLIVYIKTWVSELERELKNESNESTVCDTEHTNKD